MRCEHYVIIMSYSFNSLAKCYSCNNSQHLIRTTCLYAGDHRWLQLHPSAPIATSSLCTLINPTDLTHFHRIPCDGKLWPAPTLKPVHRSSCSVLSDILIKPFNGGSSLISAKWWEWEGETDEQQSNVRKWVKWNWWWANNSYLSSECVYARERDVSQCGWEWYDAKSHSEAYPSLSLHISHKR